MAHGSLMRSDAHADRIIDIGESVHENLLAQNQQLSGIRGVVASTAGQDLRPELLGQDLPWLKNFVPFPKFLT